jgi:hypothetical protein
MVTRAQSVMKEYEKLLQGKIELDQFPYSVGELTKAYYTVSKNIKFPVSKDDQASVAKAGLLLNNTDRNLEYERLVAEGVFAKSTRAPTDRQSLKYIRWLTYTLGAVLAALLAVYTNDNYRQLCFHVSFLVQTWALYATDAVKMGLDMAFPFMTDLYYAARQWIPGTALAKLVGGLYNAVTGYTTAVATFTLSYGVALVRMKVLYASMNLLMRMLLWMLAMPVLLYRNRNKSKRSGKSSGKSSGRSSRVAARTSQNAREAILRTAA